MLSAKPADYHRDRELLRRASCRGGEIALAALTRERLLQLSTDHGPDFATAVAYQCVRHDPKHAGPAEIIESLWNQPPGVQIRKKAGLGLIPNVGYSLDEVSRIAGDQILNAARQFGFDTFVIPTRTANSLNANADIICESLAARPGEPIVIVSISKGGADLKVAFGRPDAPYVFRNVAAWINFCGLLDGMPLVNLLLEREDAQIDEKFLIWFAKYGSESVRETLQAMRECGHGEGRPLATPLQIPPHVLPLNVVGFPRKRDFHLEHAKIFHSLSLQFGPNDGFALIADLIDKPGMIFPIWRSDHYIDRAMDTHRLSTALIGAVCRMANL